jgi:hypothetical protein
VYNHVCRTHSESCAKPILEFLTMPMLGSSHYTFVLHNVVLRQCVCVCVCVHRRAYTHARAHTHTGIQTWSSVTEQFNGSKVWNRQSNFLNKKSILTGVSFKTKCYQDVRQLPTQINFTNVYKKRVKQILWCTYAQCNAINYRVFLFKSELQNVF